MDLFTQKGFTVQGIPAFSADAPLAVRMRPQTLDELVGQDELVQTGSPLRRLIEANDQKIGPSSIILWGGPGTGKTTLAYLIAQSTNHMFVEISAVSSGVKEIRAVINRAREDKRDTGRPTVLFVDEVHRFSKSQQDSLLPAVENRWVILVAATTENPAFSVISPLLSRSLLITLHPLDATNIIVLVQRALSSERGLNNTLQIADDALDALARLAGNDARKALTLLEAAAGACAEEASVTRADTSSAGAPDTPSAGTDIPTITLQHVSAAAAGAVVKYDEDEHYDVISAFIKSMRGSDPDAALHYLARMIEAGEDPRFIARRIMICASEDVGLAAPEVLTQAVSAAQAVQMVGMPEGRIILSQAALAVALAPKSNRSYVAIERALRDVKRGKGRSVPAHLRDAHYARSEQMGVGGYKYAHDYPHHVVSQQYLPDDLVGTTYYEPSERGQEAKLSVRVQALRALLNGLENGA